MKISQLKRKIESEFEEQYPREESTLVVEVMEDVSGRPLKDVALVGDVLAQDDRVFVYPKKLGKNEVDRIPYIIDPKDLLTTIK